MMRTVIASLSAALVLVVSAPARANSYLDVEHARASARAGGPVSDYDYELLERHGATSGTPEWRRRYRAAQYNYDYDDAGHHRSHKARRRLYRH